MAKECCIAASALPAAHARPQPVGARTAPQWEPRVAVTQPGVLRRLRCVVWRCGARPCGGAAAPHVRPAPAARARLVAVVNLVRRAGRCSGRSALRGPAAADVLPRRGR